MAYLPATTPQSVIGSVFTYPQGTIVSSLVSTIPSSVIVGASIFGQVPAGTATIGSVAAIVSNFPTTQNVSGSVVSYPQGTIVTSLVSTVPSSVLVGASIFGQLPAGTAVLGSVAALQGTNPWITTFSNSSIIAMQLAGSILATSATVSMSNSSVMLLNGANVIGSVTVLQGTNPLNMAGSVISYQGTNPWVIGSIVGTYPTNTAYTAGDKGLYVLGIRNDTLGSIATIDKYYNTFITDAQGRMINKPFVSNDGTLIEFSGSIVSTSVLLIQASAIGKRSYITDFWFANTGSVATLLTFKDGSTSILGYTIAPGGGGSNSQGINLPHRTAVGQDLTVTPTTPVSVLYMTVRGYQAQ